MKSQLDKKLLWTSVFIHLLAILLIDISYNDSKIKKTFVAYGRHSKRITHAYFRQLRARNGNNQKYLQTRRKSEQAVKKVQKKKEPKKKIIKKPVKKLAKKKKKSPVKLVKSKKQKKLVAKKKTKPKKVVKNKTIQEQPKKVAQQEVLHFNLIGETDPKMIMYQQQIQSEVDRVWRPPLGADKGTECVVKFCINKKGCVTQFDVLKSSLMLIYDLSIIRVAKEFKFDKCLWGKSFVINFRQ